MKQTRLLKTCTLALTIACTAGFIVTGCVEKDLYDPNYGKQEPPAPETLPDFSNWSAINLSVDYEMPGCKTLIEVYTAYPYETAKDGSVVKTEQLPQFAAYTDDNSRYNGKLELPAGTKTVYLCTPMMGLPGCVGLDVTTSGVQFKRSDLYGEEPLTRAWVESPEKGKVPYRLDEKVNLLSLCRWGQYGAPEQYVAPEQNYLKIISGKEISGLLQRAKITLWGSESKPSELDNKEYLRSEEVTNITILKKMVNEKGEEVDVGNATIKLTLLNESGWWQNTLGYYYYPTDKKPENVNDLKKYIVFPNVSMGGNVPFDGSKYKAKNAPLKVGSQVQLKYVAADGTVSDKFPAGYTIGWFILPDAFAPSSDDDDSGELNTGTTPLYSNVSWNKDGKSRTIALTDETTGKILVGFEDGGDTSYEDVLFYIEANPAAAVFDPNRPTTDPEPDEKPDAEYDVLRTLAFEDNWPAKGDYDMNDVVVTHKQVVTFNGENKVKKIVDVFTPVQRADAATNANAFAYQVDGSQVGSYVLPEGAIYEEVTNSFILFPNAQNVREQEFTVTRTFNATFKKEELKKYNPFIIISYIAGSTERAEVHLPKMAPTSYADKDLIGAGADAYYIDKDGKHPFAIDVPGGEFLLVTEKAKIGSEGEYLRFNSWVEDKCKVDSEYADWYKKK